MSRSMAASISIAHKVEGIVDPTHPGGLGRSDPSGTDDNQKDIASTDGIVDYLAEVPPQGDRLTSLKTLRRPRSRINQS